MSEAISPVTPRRADSQTFLVGPTIYLRGVEEDDVRTISAWRNSPYTLATDGALDLVRSDLSAAAKDKRLTLIACRREDDRPVGSLGFWTEDYIWAYISPYSYRLLPDADRLAIETEMLQLFVPFILEENGLLSVTAEFDTSLPGREAAASASGLRFAYRLREASNTGGWRHDLVAWEAFSTAGIAQFGRPDVVSEGAVQREVRAPAPLRWPEAAGFPPSSAVMLGQRLYLRAVEPADAVIMARAAHEETETFHDVRWPRGPMLTAAFHRGLNEKEPLSWQRFAIVLRENDELIGSNGLTEIDLLRGAAETETEILRAVHRGAGLGTEAKHLLLTYAFEVLGLHMVRSYTWEPNTRSAAALRKQGYRDAGRISWRRILHGKPSFDLVFDLLASEWQAARSGP